MLATDTEVAKIVNQGNASNPKNHFTLHHANFHSYILDNNIRLKHPIKPNRGRKCQT